MTELTPEERARALALALYWTRRRRPIASGRRYLMRADELRAVMREVLDKTEPAACAFAHAFDEDNPYEPEDIHEDPTVCRDCYDLQVKQAQHALEKLAGARRWFSAAVKAHEALAAGPARILFKHLRGATTASLDAYTDRELPCLVCYGSGHTRMGDACRRCQP